MQPASPYDLKLAAAMGVGQFWSLPHTQLYAECGRLAEAGLLVGAARGIGAGAASTGSTRRVRRPSSAGARSPPGELYELRDAGLLKLFFGADPKKLAPQQLEAHEEKLREYEAQLRAMPPDDGARRGSFTPSRPASATSASTSASGSG